MCCSGGFLWQRKVFFMCVCGCNLLIYFSEGKEWSKANLRSHFHIITMLTTLIELTRGGLVGQNTPIALMCLGQENPFFQQQQASCKLSRWFPSFNTKTFCKTWQTNNSPQTINHNIKHQTWFVSNFMYFNINNLLILFWIFLYLISWTNSTYISNKFIFSTTINMQIFRMVSSFNTKTS